MKVTNGTAYCNWQLAVRVLNMMPSCGVMADLEQTVHVIA